MDSTDFLYSLTSTPTVDLFPDGTENSGNGAIPLPCWCRGRPKIPLKELPLFKLLKKQMEENPEQFNDVAAPSSIGRGRPLTSTTSDEEDIVGSYWRRQSPLRAPTFNTASESLHSTGASSSRGRRVPSTSQVHVPRSSDKPLSHLHRLAKESPAQRPSSKQHKGHSKKGPQVSGAKRAASSSAGGRANRGVPTRSPSFRPEHFSPADSLDSWVASMSQARPQDENSSSEEGEPWQPEG